MEESPELTCNPESREKDKQLTKKAEVSREKRKTASQPSSSKRTAVAKNDFIEGLKASISESMIEGFRHISKSLSSDIAEVLSNAGNSSKRSHDDRLSESAQRTTKFLLEKYHESRAPRTTSPLTSL